MSRKTRQTARAAAVRLLCAREHSVKELRDKLRLREYTCEEVDDALNFLHTHDLQSDTRFAASRARLLASRKGDSRTRLDLRSKGVSEEATMQALAALPAEAERALHAARRFEGTEQTRTQQARQWRFLASRGFSTDSIKQALQHLRHTPVDD